jgi:hypothetical protein
MELNGKSVSVLSLGVDGVDSSDYPDFCDAYFSYFSYATYEKGSPLSDDDLDALSDKYSEILSERVLAHFTGAF